MKIDYLKDYTFIKGSDAVAKTVYNFIEAFYIFPITPSTSVSFAIRDMSIARKKNINGIVPYVHQYQSEAGVAAGVHGALQNGVLASTCTGSQGLLLMIPNIYKMVGELLPAVIHVATRSIATRSLSIQGDHSDIYAIRATGAIMISAATPQEAHDLSAISYSIALGASYPVIHFYEATTVSNLFSKIKLINDVDYKKIMNKINYTNFKTRALSPFSPVTVGGHENEDTFFQGREAANKNIEKCGFVVKEELLKLSKILGRNYEPYEYYGFKHAENVMIAMGSITESAKDVVDDLNTKGYRCGILKITLYRPFLCKEFVSSIPDTAMNFAVMSRTKENGAPAEPLFVDVATAFSKEGRKYNILCNGRYGLSSKNMWHGDIKSIFDNLTNKPHKSDFTIGIVDDVTNLSLPRQFDYTPLQKNFSWQALFYGSGGDGTVSLTNSVANVLATKDKYQDVRLNSVYNSLKENNITRSMIEVSHNIIRTYRLPRKFSYALFSLDTLLLRINACNHLNDGATLILNTTFDAKSVELFLPNSLKKDLATKNCKLLIIDANKIAKECKLNNKTSMILSAAFFNIISQNKDIYNEYIELLKQNVIRMFSKKGQEIVDSNIKAIMSVNHKTLLEVKVKPEWKNISVFKKAKEKLIENDYDAYSFYVDTIESLKGDEIPVSSVKMCGSRDMTDGSMLNNNNTFNSKKKTNILTPRWIPERCIQCNKCALVCPHATIRAFLLSPKEVENAPQQMETLYAVGAEGYRFRIQVDNENCVGCSLCAEVCPVDALEMVPVKEEHDKHTELTNYLYKNIDYKTGDFSTDMYKGVTFLYPYFEASGACKGCGETPYYRLLTQLFGKFMVIANATGCTSIYGGHQNTPFARDKDGCGPAWANSLFEDNAEFGLGIRTAEDFKISRMFEIIIKYYKNTEPNLESLLSEILNNYHKADRLEQFKNREKIIELVKKSSCTEIKELLSYKDVLVRKSFWMIGGDGWAYDIGFGGIRHVVDSGKNVNILILNTETYSNTGGQISAASGVIAGGKPLFNSALRTELGQMLLTHKNVYVAQVSLGMNPNQVIKAFNEAESYDGPSVIIAYCPCISHGFNLRYHSLNQREAVLSGYWPIFRYDPRLINLQKNPLQIDFKSPKFETIPKFIFPQRRFKMEFLKDKDYEIQKLNNFINYLKRNFETLVTLSSQQFNSNEDYYKIINETISKNN